MSQRRRFLIALAGATLALAGAAGAASAAHQPVPGFQAPLRGEGVDETAGPECFVSRGTLSCAYAGKLPQDASCDAGGAVPTVRLRPTGRARQSYLCFDEGFHDWHRLLPGRSWSHRSFRCRHGWSGSGDARHGVLRCSNGSHGFRVYAGGDVRRF